MLFERLERAGRDARDLAGVRLCASGATTVDAVRRRFLRVDAAPDRFEAEHVIAAMESAGPLKGTKILIPRADLARSSLAHALREVGAEVTEWAAYRAVATEPSDPYVHQLLMFRPELLVFTSTQAVRGFMEALPPEARETLRAAPVASIGPVTSEALRVHGMTPVVEPAHHEVRSLVEAIVAWAQQRALRA
jgi:uroporphyrinogen III methyltransferase/synthase